VSLNKLPAECKAKILVKCEFFNPLGSVKDRIAKAMIDEGFHPMTMYFPLVVHGAMLIEPTESESRATLDQFIGAMRDLAFAVHHDKERLKGAPYYAPRRRLDETKAAREPKLRWRRPADLRHTSVDNTGMHLSFTQAPICWLVGVWLRVSSSSTMSTMARGQPSINNRSRASA
jgi:glycine cleavage system protein P-like pyridoxal-binding family